MEDIEPSAVTPSKSKWVHILSKVLHLHTVVVGIVPDDEVQKDKPKEIEEWNDSKTTKRLSQKFGRLHDEEFERIMALEVFIAKIFATVSAIKAGYAQLQHAQSPYDSEGIQAADRLEQKSLLKTFEIMGKKLESQLRLKESEIIFLREKLDESNKQKREMFKAFHHPYFSLLGNSVPKGKKHP
ncbi:hypothetical protein CRYUN_Cryun28dG0006700 [Craigia yunnanensis]